MDMRGSLLKSNRDPVGDIGIKLTFVDEILQDIGMPLAQVDDESIVLK